jgi:hypothetical protein
MNAAIAVARAEYDDFCSGAERVSTPPWPGRLSNHARTVARLVGYVDNEHGSAAKSEWDRIRREARS